MKRIASFIMLFVMLTAVLAACGSGGGSTGTGASSAPTGAESPAASTSTGGASAAASTGGEASAAASTGSDASAAASTGASGAAAPASGSATAGGGSASCAPKGPKVDKLVWWTGEQQDGPAYQAFTAIAQKYTEATGTPIEIVSVPDQFKEKMALSAPAGEGPDVFGPRAHDETGEYVIQKIAAEIPRDSIPEASEIAPVAFDGVTVNGKQYGVPILTDNVGLYYNKDVVAQPPADWAGFTKAIKDAQAAGKTGLAYPFLEAYYTGAYFLGNGGYVFKYNNGTFDTNDIGLNKPETIAAMKLLRDMYHKDKLVPDVAVDRQNMAQVTNGEFEAGNVAMSINGPWQEDAFKKAGVNYGVAKLPTLPDGKPMKPFLTVQTFLASDFSKNKDAAKDFAIFLGCTDSVVEMNKVFNKAPVRQSALAPSVAQNANIQFWAAQAADGVAMPNIPAMTNVWKPLNDAIDAVVVNNAPDDQVQGIMDTAVQQIKDAIARTQ